MPYQPEWIPLIEMIAHIRATDHCDEQQAALDAKNVLYEGKVESRRRGSDEWDRIESSTWASATIFKNGLVSFSWPSAGVPAPGCEPPRFLVEVLRKDVLQFWPKRQRSRSAERNCLQWLVQDLKSRGVKTVSKGDRRQHAHSTFGVSRRAFDDRVWPDGLEELEPELRALASTAGRKQKSTHGNRRTK